MSLAATLHTTMRFPYQRQLRETWWRIMGIPCSLATREMQDRTTYLARAAKERT